MLSEALRPGLGRQPFCRWETASKAAKSVAVSLMLIPLLPDFIAPFLMPLSFFFCLFSKGGRARLKGLFARNQSVVWCFLAFVFLSVVFVSSASAIGPSVLTALLWVVCFLAMLGTAASVENTNELHLALSGLYIGILISAVLAVCQAIHFSTGMPFPNPFWVPMEQALIDAIPFLEVDLKFVAERSTAAFTNSGVFGFYLAMSVPLCFYLIARAEGRRQQLLYAIPLLAASVSLAVTYSRMSYITFLAVIFLLLIGYAAVHFYRLSAAKRAMIVGGMTLSIPLICFLLLFLVPASVRDRFLSAFHTDNSINVRFALWQASAWLLLVKEPIRLLIGFGTGVQNTWDRFRQIAFLQVQGQSLIQPHAHNLAIQLLLEGGIFRLLSFVVLMVVCFRACFRDFGSRSRKGKYFLISLSGFFAALLLNGLTDYVFVDPKICYYFAAVMGFLPILSRFTFPEDRTEPEDPFRRRKKKGSGKKHMRRKTEKNA